MSESRKSLELDSSKNDSTPIHLFLHWPKSRLLEIPSQTP